MLVEAPEYNSNDGSSSANITDTEGELPKKRWQTTKKDMKLMQEL